MRDIKFAKVFPAYHPRKGEPTGFKQKILEGIKTTTIRAGDRWKEGDWFQPKEWSGLPYRSKPVNLQEPMQIIQVECFDIAHGHFLLEGKIQSYKQLQLIAKLDGFDDLDDFELWFNDKGFLGQRLHFR